VTMSFDVAYARQTFLSLAQVVHVAKESEAYDCVEAMELVTATTEYDGVAWLLI
jgi:hypothetical protein